VLGSDILVKMLTDYGVDTIFGVPGDTNVPLYTALSRAEGNIKHVMARDERSAGFMADGYARISNKVGIFEAPSGAGAMYSLPPLAESNASSVPVILFTIDIPLTGEGRGMLTELDNVSLFDPVTKASIQVKSPQKLPEIIRRAFRIATTGKPGAVHVIVPEDMLIVDIDLDTVSLHVEKDCGRFPAIPTVAPPSELEKILALINNSSRPLIVAGGGVNRSAAQSELTSLAEQMNIPVVNTITGQGAIPDNHPLAIGVIGDNGYHPHANKALEEADLVIYLGSKIGSVVTIGYTFPSQNPDRHVVQVDIDSEVLSNNTQNVLSVAGDIRLVVMELSRLDNTDPKKNAPWIDTLNNWRKIFWENAEPLFDERTVPLRPEPIVKALNDRITAPVNIMSDAGTPTPYMTRFLRLGDSRSRFIIPRAFGGLGYAIPAVVGAWKAEPEKRPIGLFGDGSLGMTAGELETLSRLNCPAILLHFNNACFGWIKGLHRLQGIGNNDCFSVDFNVTQGHKLAESFGIKAWRVQSMDELEAALDQAFAYNGPTFIDIIVESLAERVPPVFSWLSKRGEDPLALESEDIGYDKRAI